MLGSATRGTSRGQYRLLYKLLKPSWPSTRGCSFSLVSRLKPCFGLLMMVVCSLMFAPDFSFWCEGVMGMGMGVIGIGLLTDERVLFLTQVRGRSGAGWVSSVRRDWSEVFPCYVPPLQGKFHCFVSVGVCSHGTSVDVSIQAAFCFPCSGKGFSHTTMACFRREGVRGGGVYHCEASGC